MQKIRKYATLVSVSIISMLVGRYVFQTPKRVEIKEVIKFVEKKEEASRKNKKTVIRENKKPDGTTNTETIIVEDSTSVIKTETSFTSEKSKVVTQHKLSLGLLAIKDLPNFKNNLEYGVLVSVPVLGSISVTTMVDTTKRVGVGLSIGF
jgi:hypothetical protein